MFDLTPTEKRTVLILVLVVCASGIVQLFRPVLVRSQFYDYSYSDSVFYRTSRNFFNHGSDSGLSDFSREEQSVPLVTTVKENKSNTQLPAPGSIDLNRASKTDLELLPHIGPAMANRIIEFRKSHVRFKSVQDLRKIKGIGEKTIKKIIPYLKEIQ
jgi:competence ComEA-like helix-hairpin-helix protein